MRTLSLFALLGLVACSSASSSGGNTSQGAGGSTSSSHTSTSATSSSGPSGTGGTGSSTTSSAAGTGTGGAGTTGAGTGGMPFTPGQPITAPAEQWTWVPFDDAFCANGKSTGIGVNLSSTPNARVLFYFEGGGACWSDITCYTLMTASYFTSGYGEAEFQAESSDNTYLAMPGGFFDRTAASNPFKDYNYIYVPYCTGDVHAGDNLMKYTSTHVAHHVGYRNVTAYLDRIVPTFPSTDRVIIAGSSAGGFGAAFNWWQTQQAFGSKIRVDLLDDSGTPMPPDIEADGYGEGNLRTAWNLAATLPPGCTQCKQSLVGLLGFYEQQFPTHRLALLSYVQDSVLPSFFGITEPEFEQGLMEDQTNYFGASTNAKYFTVNSADHVLFFGTIPSTDYAPLQQFVTQMVTDDPSWASQAL